jgi:hypothetical protein
MIVDTGKKLNENEKTDAMYIITSLNTTLEYLRTIQDFSALNEQQMADYWAGICDAFVEARINEYRWRKEISQKYEVPYTFISRNGDLLIEEPQEEEE